MIESIDYAGAVLAPSVLWSIFLAYYLMSRPIVRRFGGSTISHPPRLANPLTGLVTCSWGVILSVQLDPI
jgi:hypothetical protein